jgi:hypothetical protein
MRLPEELDHVEQSSALYDKVLGFIGSHAIPLGLRRTVGAFFSDSPSIPGVKPESTQFLSEVVLEVTFVFEVPIEVAEHHFFQIV